MKVEIVAELAQGFEGSLEQTKLLVKAAAKAGANAAKFQLVYADELATPDYQYYDLFTDLEMTDDQWSDVKSFCDSYDIELILDVFGIKGLKLVEKLHIKTIKLHATDINNIGFLSDISESSIERIMVGTGGAYVDEIKRAVDILGSKTVVLFHGFQGYPTEISENQISRLDVLADIFSGYNNVDIGFSDHVEPTNISCITVPAYAIGCGATSLEKHLTLGCCMELEDHEAAMNPDQFKVFVESIRDIELAYGSSDLTNDFGMSAKEKQYRENIRRHVVTAKELTMGQEIQTTDVLLKRTSSSTAYMDLNSVYGKELTCKLEENSPINEGELN